MKLHSIMLILTVLILVLASCSSKTGHHEITKNISGGCIPLNPEEDTFLRIGDSLILYGQNCSINLTLKDTTYNSITLQIGNETIEAYDYEPKWVNADFYIHVINAYDNGARIVINKKFFYNKSEHMKKVLSCFRDISCDMTCRDFDGFHSEICPNGTIPATKLPFKIKIKDLKDCCINYPPTYYVTTSQKEYSKGETLKIYFFGPNPLPCSVDLISKDNKSFHITDTLCKPFSQLASRELFSSFGELYGPWKVKVTLPKRFGKDWIIGTDFLYKQGELMYKDIELKKNSTMHFTFLNKNYSLSHIKGCNYGINIALNNDTYSLNVGEAVETEGITLIIRGAPCRKGRPISIRIQRPFHPKCNNGFCEAGETKDTCPWDCLDIKPLKAEAPLEETECSSGCYYDKKCLVLGSRLSLRNNTFACSKDGWKAVP